MAATRIESSGDKPDEPPQGEDNTRISGGFSYGFGGFLRATCRKNQETQVFGLTCFMVLSGFSGFLKEKKIGIPGLRVCLRTQKFPKKHRPVLSLKTLSLKNFEN